MSVVGPQAVTCTAAGTIRAKQCALVGLNWYSVCSCSATQLCTAVSDLHDKVVSHSTTQLNCKRLRLGRQAQAWLSRDTCTGIAEHLSCCRTLQHSVAASIAPLRPQPSTMNHFQVVISRTQTDTCHPCFRVIVTPGIHSGEHTRKHDIQPAAFFVGVARLHPSSQRLLGLWLEQANHPSNPSHP